MSEQRRLLRLKQVCDKVGLGKSAIYDLIRFGDPPFPAPIKIGSSTSRWVESEVDAWIDQRIAAHREAG